MCEVNYYRVLSIPRKATLPEIKTAYRQLAMQYHPDRNRRPDAPVQFRRVQEAYDCLIDPNARHNHDLALCSEFDEIFEVAAEKWNARSREVDAVAAQWNAGLTVSPQMLLGFFLRLDGWCRRAFA
jgi:DnaJ-class molecular chaperone